MIMSVPLKESESLGDEDAGAGENPNLKPGTPSHNMIPGGGTNNDNAVSGRDKRQGHSPSGNIRHHKSRHQQPNAIMHGGSSDAKMSRAHRRSSLPANISFGLPNNTDRISQRDQERLEWIHQQTRHHRMIRERLRHSSVSDGSSIPHSITTRSSFSQSSHQPSVGLSRNRSNESLFEVLPKGGGDRSRRLSPPIINASQKSADNDFAIRFNSLKDQNTGGLCADGTSPQNNHLPKARHNIGMRRGSLDSSLMSYVPKRTCQTTARRPKSSSLDLSDNQRKADAGLLSERVLPRRRSQSEDKKARCLFNSSINHRPHSLDGNEGGERGHTSTDIAPMKGGAENRKERIKKKEFHEQERDTHIAMCIEFPRQATEVKDTMLDMKGLYKGDNAGRRNTIAVAINPQSKNKVRSGDRRRERRKSERDTPDRKRRAYSTDENNLIPKIIRLDSENSVERKAKRQHDSNMVDIELGDPISDGNKHSADVDSPPLSQVNRVRKIKDKKKSSSTGLFRVTPLILCATCLCYCISLLVVGGLGFWLHMSLSEEEESADNDLQGTPTLRPSYQSASNNEVTMESKITPSTSSTPSSMPSSSSYPSSYPSIDVTSTPSISYEPTLQPSVVPSSSPTTVPVCPDQLKNSISIGDDNILTFNYEVVMSSFYPGGGLLCASLDYAGVAGWIGVAFSEASRDPQFGLKEAVIGIPGLETTTAAARGGSASVGQQGNVVLDDMPTYFNPAKYLIPAGGIDTEGYRGPSLKLLMHKDMQTLVNASVSFIHDVISDDGTDGRANETMHRTQLNFVKYLFEPNEINIDPYGSNLVLFAVAAVNEYGEYDGNPEWQSTNLVLDGSLDIR